MNRLIPTTFRSLTRFGSFGTTQQYTASIDQSTTGTKFSLFELNGTLVDQQIIPHQQISLHQGWLEHNPTQIIKNVQHAISNVISRQKNNNSRFSHKDIVGIGLCNQRQTLVCWDANTGMPLHNAIVWSDSRTADVCHRFEQKYGNFKNVTGLPVSTYFSLFKILWYIENVPLIKQKLQKKEAMFGTIDTWVAFNLTGKYVTDASNASRTHLYDLNTGKWSDQLLGLVKITDKSLPSIIDSFEDIGPIKTGTAQGCHIRSILGDQQSSAYSHNIHNDEMKITYGTGCFMLNNMGVKPNFHDAFVTTVLWSKKGMRNFGYEASIQCGGGTINWAKRLNLFDSYSELNNLSECPEQLVFLPSFGSIFSPFWKPGTSGNFLGLGFNTTRQHMMQSILEGISFRIFDNVNSSEFNQISKVIVDGGLCQNKKFMQMQADLFGKQIQVRTLDTCWGVAKGVLLGSSMEVQQKKFETSNYHPNPQKAKYYQQKYQFWCQKRKLLYGI